MNTQRNGAFCFVTQFCKQLDNKLNRKQIEHQEPHTDRRIQT